MKKTLLFLIVAQLVVYSAKAQLGYNYRDYTLGFGAAYNSATTDITPDKSYPALNLNFAYNLTPYTRFTVEYQFGQLAGNSNVAYLKAVASLDPKDAKYASNVVKLAAELNPYPRYYVNHYQSGTIYCDLQFGELIDYSDGGFGKFFRNIYIGTGVGMIYNNITDKQKYNADTTYAYGGSDHANNVMIPLRVGYQFKFYNAYNEPSVLFEIGYQDNIVFGYGLDGYSDPLFTTKQFGTFGGWHAGLKFNFGNITSYRKSIR